MSQDKVDEGLYSRQLYVLGHETMKRMQTTDILLVGLRGVGLEIAKNIILMGIKSVTLYDPTPVQWDDLACQFYVSDADIGRSRAAATYEKLAELNQYVSVSVHDGALEESFISRFQVVCVTDAPLDELLRINDICHQRGIKFVSADTRGVFARVFCDFGTDFEVFDQNGEPAQSYMISAITNESSGVVTVLDEARIALEDGDHVTFSEVEGMNELNGQAPVPVKVLGPYSLSIGDTTQFGRYTQRGYVHQVKVPKKFSFKSLRESLSAPDLSTQSLDFSKMDNPSQLHIGFQALDAFARKHGRYPSPRNASDAAEVFAFAKQINETTATGSRVEQLSDKLLASLSSNATGSFVGVTAAVGGIAAQEILKASSGKFTPLIQFLYFDAIEMLPTEDEKNPFAENEFADEGSRYDGQIRVLGRTLNHTLLNMKYFLVGAGAIGCEVLKNWAMMGIGAGAQGLIHVTDMDVIERSNLSRQFLFRNSDIEKLKSETAARAVQRMNPAINVKAYSLRVGPDSENVYNEEFYSSLDGVCNALDNVEARLYMDQQCIAHRKSLLDSGTLGTKGNVQVVVPNLTESYGSSRDPPEKSIPTCTLHHFPNKIDHTLQWARDAFEGYYAKAPEAVNSYLTNPDYLDGLHKQSAGLRLETVRTVKSYLVANRPRDFPACIAWARLKFEELFNHNPLQLLHNFPRDMITSTGQPFWSGPKRAPEPVQFDANNSLHLDFIIAASNLLAVVYGLQGERNPELFRQVVAGVEVPPFVPRKVHIETEEKKEGAAAAEPEDDSEIADRLQSELPKPSELAGFRLTEIDFEKDDDTNFHMDFITAASNLRATNYSIPHADKHTSKGIAGKIIPAMITTTAVVSALAVIEMVKLIQKKPLESYRNSFLNLALPVFAFSEPVPPPKNKIRENWSWTLWDRFDIEGPLTLKQFLAHFEKHYNLEVTMVSAGVTMLYSFFMNKDKLAQRMNLELSEVFKSVANKEIDPSKRFLSLEICCTNLDDDEDVDVPYVRYKFRN